MKFDTTERGLRAVTFDDRNDNECSLHESSIATESCIWLGCDDANPKVFIPYADPAWQPLDLPELPEGGCYSFNTRMHLTQETVKELLPLLEYFAEHGVLPESVPEPAPSEPMFDPPDTD